MHCTSTFDFINNSIVTSTSNAVSVSNIFSVIVFVQWGGAVVLTLCTKLLGIHVYVEYCNFDK